jgi:hypothetical protein
VMYQNEGYAGAPFLANGVEDRGHPVRWLIRDGNFSVRVSPAIVNLGRCHVVVASVQLS